MSRRAWSLTLGGALLALVGEWGAWVPHKAAALVLCGWDLTEFVKFLPGVRAGTEPVTREVFYLPVWCVALVLASLAHRVIDGEIGRIRRLLLMALGLVLMLLILPPYPFIKTAHQLSEFRGQFYLGVVGVLLVLCSPLLSYAKSYLFAGLSVVLALLGGVPALWQFALLRPKIQGLYGAPLGLGWGVVALVIGWGLVFMVGIRLCVQRD